jgi:hypothetical protein
VPIVIQITADSALQAHEEIAALAGLLQARNVGFATSGPQEPYIPQGNGIAAGALGAAQVDVGALGAAQVDVGTEAPKRTRRTKAQIEADAKAAEAQAPAVLDKAANISATPEDRQDPAETEENDAQGDLFDEDGDGTTEEDDLIDGYAVTDEGLVAAMKAYVAKFDMAAAQTNAKVLFGGYTKRSEVTAAGPAAVATAIRNFANAVSTGKAA